MEIPFSEGEIPAKGLPVFNPIQPDQTKISCQKSSVNAIFQQNNHYR